VTARLLGLRVRILLSACTFLFYMFVLCCVVSALCDGSIARSEESYRVCVCMCLIVCDLETSKLDGLGPVWAVEVKVIPLQARCGPEGG